MPTFKSRSAYRAEVKRRFAKIMPPLLKYAAPSHAATCPPTFRQEIPLPAWLALPQEDREVVIRGAVRSMIHAELGLMPAPAESQDRPKPKAAPAPAPAPATAAEPEAEEPEPIITTRFFTLCHSCGVPTNAASARPKFTYCHRRSCRERKRKRVNG